MPARAGDWQRGPVEGGAWAPWLRHGGGMGAGDVVRARTEHRAPSHDFPEILPRGRRQADKQREAEVLNARRGDDGDGEGV